MALFIHFSFFKSSVSGFLGFLIYFEEGRRREWDVCFDGGCLSSQIKAENLLYIGITEIFVSFLCFRCMI